MKKRTTNINGSVKNSCRSGRKEKSFYIDIPVWGARVFVFCGHEYPDAFKRFVRTLKKNGIAKNLSEVDPDAPNSSTTGRTLLYQESKGVGLWFRLKQPGGGIVAHEAVHVAAHILRVSGVTLTHESEEAYAYLVHHVVQEIGKKVW